MVPLSELKIGSEDNFGHTIKEIFGKEQDKYVIYKCEGSDDIIFDGDPESCKRFNLISADISEIDSISFGLKKKNTFILEQKIYAIRTVLEDDKDGAKQILDKLKQKVNNIKLLKGRLNYIYGSLTLLILILALTLSLSYIFNVAGSIITHLKVAFFGSIGGVLSIIISIQKKEIEYEFGIWNYITGISRIIISVLCSIILYYGIQAGIVFSFIKNSNNISLVYVFSIVAGFSETFIPNVLESLSKDVKLSSKG